MFCGILFPFLTTALGAAVVYLIHGSADKRMQRLCLGFAAGVMTAASAFSLLVPAAQQLEETTGMAWLVLAGAFLLGAALIFMLDVFLERARGMRRLGTQAHRDCLLLAAITLHNIPEGMAVGLAFALAGAEPTAAAAAGAVALGIGLQNLPEGAAVAMPLRQSGMSRRRSFASGALSGAVEPAAALCMLLLADVLSPALPALMAFSAGTMMAVVFSELAPASAVRRDGMIASMIGFALMMALDVGLG